MTKRNPSAVEGALAQALIALRHSDDCHKVYINFKTARTALEEAKKGCSRCLTGSKAAKHSEPCRNAWAHFEASRRLLAAVQGECPKCQSRSKLQEVLGHGKS